MFAPSRLKKYPVGATIRTACLVQSNWTLASTGFTCQSLPLNGQAGSMSSSWHSLTAFIEAPEELLDFVFQENDL